MNPNNFYQGGIPIGSGEVNCNNEAELHPALGKENISQVMVSVMVMLLLEVMASLVLMMITVVSSVMLMVVCQSHT